MGMNYLGIDLSGGQIEANKEQASKVSVNGTAEWIVGDSSKLDEHSIPVADFLFSCPPYHDLEHYSDDPADISNMGYNQFLVCYRTIIAKSVSLLDDNRFAAFVVSEIRDKRTGNYQGFVGDTVDAFRDAGLNYYNSFILINSVGSLPVRIARQFDSRRKAGRCHQNVLVFVKGDPRKATDACATNLHTKCPIDRPKKKHKDIFAEKDNSVLC